MLRNLFVSACALLVASNHCCWADEGASGATLDQNFRFVQQRNNNQVVSESDPSLKFVGEYDLLREAMGTRTPRYGVQVTCIGNDRYRGFLLKGGLPGVGGDTAHPIALRGQLAGDVVELTGEGVAVHLRPEEAVIELAASDKQPATTVTLQRAIRRSKTLGMPAPAGAIVIFDGKESSELKDGRLTDDGFLRMGTETTRPYGAFQMHAEFRTPYMPRSNGQQRGNSGIYIQRRYEVQILDSFGFDNVNDSAGSIYKQRQPDLNMSLPPLVWQTYDIEFHPPTWKADGKKDRMATLTVIHNGVPVHYQNVITAKTGNGQPEGPEPLSILFQNHNDPVVYRNVWIIPLDASPSTASKTGVVSQPLPTQRALTGLTIGR